MLIGTAKESYRADEALFTTRPHRLWVIAFLAALALAPFGLDDYWLYLACLAAINVASATGLNILTGYTGLVSLGQAAFMAVGAYTVAWLEQETAVPSLLALVAGGLVAAAVGVVFGIPSLRVKGLYLAIATIAASFILHFVFVHWESVTNGNTGLSVAPASVLGVELTTYFALYYLIVPVTVLLVLGAANLFRTRIGRAFIAIRDRDISAEVLGIPLMRYKLMSFAIASFYAGVAGGLWAYVFRVMTPDTFPFLMSVFLLAAIIVGGIGTILGGILGAIFMTLTPELLRFVFDALSPIWPNAASALSPVRTIVFGALIVLFLVFEPRGLAEIIHRVRRSWQLWPFKT